MENDARRRARPPDPRAKGEQGVHGHIAGCGDGYKQTRSTHFDPVVSANMKVAVIGSDGTGCQDAVKHDFNGIIVQRKNVEEVKEAMMTYLEDKALLKKHGENGPIWSQNFQQVIIWQGLDNIYKNQ
jgi:hypothetical protein